MHRHHSTFASTAIRVGKTLLDSLRGLIVIDTRTYAPEKHYMRGPGPKWREKHGRNAINTL